MFCLCCSNINISNFFTYFNSVNITCDRYPADAELDDDPPTIDKRSVAMLPPAADADPPTIEKRSVAMLPPAADADPELYELNE